MSIRKILYLSLCIQESWAHEEIDMTYFSLPNYTLTNANRRLSLYDGFIIYIHDDFAYTEISDIIPILKTSTLFESIFIKIWKKIMSSEVCNWEHLSTTLI